MEKTKVYLSLGGNIGDRKGYIQKAIKMIGKINGILKYWESLSYMKLLQLDI